MRIRKALFTALFTLLCATSAEGAYDIQASPTLTREIKVMMNGMLFGPLIAGMNTKVGWLDIPQLVGEITQIKVSVNISNELMFGSGNRVGGINLTKDKTVIFNSRLLSLIQGNGTDFARVGVDANMLHEVLGALGYPDENYEISMFLYMRGRLEEYGSDVRRLSEIFVEEHLMKNPTRRTENATYIREGGTSTGVGGGGDPVSLALKLASVSWISQNRGQIIGSLVKNEGEMVDVLKLIQSLKVEPQTDEIPYDIAKPIHSLTEAIRIVENSWLSVDTSLAFTVRTPEDVSAVSLRFLEASLEILRKNR